MSIKRQSLREAPDLLDVLMQYEMFSYLKLGIVDKQVSLNKYSIYSDLLCFAMKHYMVFL